MTRRFPLGALLCHVPRWDLTLIVYGLMGFLKAFFPKQDLTFLFWFDDEAFFGDIMFGIFADVDVVKNFVVQNESENRAASFFRN